MTAGSTTQKFSYDSSGSVVSVNYNGTEYYYLRNAQGDIVAMIDSTGTKVVQYSYDSWGKQLSCTGALATTLGTNQPFRYRGYVYDPETGWYYLQSRYYNPEVGRFISSDVLLSTGQGVLGHDAYAYCLNNPVNMMDYGGTAPRDVRNQPYTDEGTFFSNGYETVVEFHQEGQYETAEEATLEFAKRYYNADYEYGSCIYSYVDNDGNTWYTFTTAWTDGEDGDLGSRSVNNVPAGYKLIACIHSHPHTVLNMRRWAFSNEDMNSMWSSGVPLYLVTPKALYVVTPEMNSRKEAIIVSLLNFD